MATLFKKAAIIYSAPKALTSLPFTGLPVFLFGLLDVMNLILMKKLYLFFIIIFFSTIAFAQRKYTISGSVKSKESGESLPAVNIVINDGDYSTITNEYGFYSLTIPHDAYNMSFSAVGYEILTEKIILDSDIVKNIILPQQIKSLEKVEVTAKQTGRTILGTQMGVEHLSIEEMKTIPMLFGERDILKAIQLLPGIKPAGDGNSGFYVRGGSTDQNLILLDEAVVYNASHLLGFFSTFNSDIIKDITVYKGGMPAQYGGRLSSVLDVKMNEGNNQKFNVSGGIGLISAKLNIEGPIQKDKSSFLLSGRRTYADLFLGLAKDTAIRSNKLYFYDYNAKMNYILGEKDRLYLSGYFGRDYLSLDKQFGIDWGNTTATLRWNHIFNNKLFSNTSLIYSNFDYNININNPNNNLSIFSRIRDINFKHELQWYAGINHSFRFGINAIHHNIKPGEITSSGNSSFNNLFLQNRYSWETALFATDNWKMNPWLNFTYGLRMSMFSIIGPGDFYNVNGSGNIIDTLRYEKGMLVKNYFNLEPRVAASFILNNNTSIKTSYVRNTQNLHLISNAAANTPADKWIASTNIIKPEISDMFSLGWYKNLNNNQYEITTEAYFKTMQNQIDYKSDADVYTNDAIESQILPGIGRAFGVEMMVKKKTGKLTGWLSYTLSKTERKINGINDDDWYNARQDRTHDISLVVNYQAGKKWNLSANWVYYTGDAVTFPAGKYIIDNQIVFYYTKRNAYRMPNYHRLDLGATMQLKTRRNFSSELAFSIFNVYGRENAYTINFEQGEDDPNTIEAIKTSLFKFVPSISYHFKF